jgi:hypothetical protein
VYSIAKIYCINSCSFYFTIAVAFKSLYIYVNLFANPFYIKNMYFTSIFLVVKLLASYSIKYNLKHLSDYPAKDNPA